MWRKRCFNRPTGRVLILILGTLLVLFTFPFTPTARATHPSFAAGDVFVSRNDGRVEWYHPDGTLRAVLSGSLLAGSAQGMAFDASGNLFATRWCNSAIDILCTNDTVDKFAPDGSFAGAFGGPYADNPGSIVFDAAANAFVGQADTTGDILKFSSAGVLLGSFDAAQESRGTFKIDLAGDGCTVFYTSFGSRVLRFNVCANTQIPDFALLPDTALGLRVLPDGGVLVAAASVIVRFNSSGDQIATFDIPFEGNLWFGVDLDVDSSKFWAADHLNLKVVKFDLNTGEQLQTIFTLAPPKDVVVKKAPLVIKARGRMTGGGSIFTDLDDTPPGGVRITHGFELHCDKNRKPNNLEINVHDGVRSRFHLEQLTFAQCSDDPTISPNPPNAPFDTYEGRGTGRWNGQSGATAEWIFTDAGEPGTNDRIRRLVIRDPNGNIVVNVNEPGHTLTFGNHQAHR